MEQAKWSENVILVDAGYLDRVAFDLTVNFERMINRQVPAADLCHWLDCVALDGGITPGANEIQAVFLYNRSTPGLRHFNPGSLKDELDGKAFRDNLGEFTVLSFPVEEVVSAEDFFIESLEHIVGAEEVKRVMVVADMETCGNRVKRVAGQAQEKDITLFAMEPLTGRGFNGEILGYSLMSALGIRGEELGG